MQRSNKAKEGFGRSLIKYVGVAMLISMAAPVFAESAPVYDADSMQQQFDNSDQQNPDQQQAQTQPQVQTQAQQDYPPPPPGQDGTFVPASQVSQQAQVSSAPVVVSSNSPLPLEQRLRKVEQQVNNMENGDTSARVDSLQSQVQSLRSQLEQVTHQLQQLQNQQKSMYSDLDKRVTVAQSKPLNVDTSSSPTMNTDDVIKDVVKPVKPKKISQPKVVVADTSASSSAPAVDNTENAPAKNVENQPNVAEEQQIYQTAYNLIKAKKYNDAVSTLQKMLQKYPSGQFASNAHYWLGELYGLLGKNDQSLSEFNAVVKNYSTSPRVSDAQLKIGLLLASSSKWSEAKSAFKKVINHYPGTASARLASEQLKQIKQAGH